MFLIRRPKTVLRRKMQYRIEEYHSGVFSIRETYGLFKNVQEEAFYHYGN